MLWTRGLAFGLALAWACAAEAQVTTTVTTTAPGGTTVRRVTQLIGSNVRLQGSNQFGKVEDVVLAESGAPSYLVVSNNGRYVMMPWQAANIDYGQRVVTYNVTPKAIQPLTFAPTTWPNLTDPQWTTRVTQVFPNAGVTRREMLRPAAVVGPGGAVVAPPAPGGPVVEEKIKVKRNGTVKIKERER